MFSAKIRIDQRYMTKRFALCGNGVGVVGGIHQIVEIVAFGAGQRHQRDGHLRIMHRGGGENARNRNLTASDIDMELIAGPAFLESLAIFLGADIACGGEVGAHLFDGLCRLVLQPRRLWWWPFLRFFWASRFFL
jgi:hypothetical protein